MSGAGADAAPWPVHVYDTATGAETVTYLNHDNAIVSTAVSPDGRWVATGGGNNKEIHIWDSRSGERRKGPDGQPLTLGGTGQPVWSVGFSGTPQRIGWGDTNANPGGQTLINDRGHLEYALPLPVGDARLTGPVALSDEENFRRAVSAMNDTSLRLRTGGRYNLAAILIIESLGRAAGIIERDLTNGNQHRSFTFTPDGRTIISGGSHGWLTAYDRKGRKLGDYIGHEGDVWAVATSPDGRYLVSGSADMTVRLWNLKTRELLVTLFRGKDGEWVMWTPEGFFMSSTKGAAHMGWQLNQGPSREARYVTGDRLYATFYRPDLVREKILGDPDGRVRKAAAKLDIAKAMATGDAPEVSIIPPPETVDSDQITVEADVTDRGGGIGRVEWKVNGTTQGDIGQRGLGRMDQGSKTIRQTLMLAPGENVITLTVYNGTNVIASKPSTVEVTLSATATKTPPRLYVLAVGINDYLDGRMRLKYAVPDASQLAAVLNKAGHGLYQSVEVITLTDSQVTQNGLTVAFDELAKKARPRDVLVFYAAGHGKTVDGRYYFLPRDFRYNTEASIVEEGVGQDQWQTWFAKVPAQKSVLILTPAKAVASPAAASSKSPCDPAWNSRRQWAD